MPDRPQRPNAPDKGHTLFVTRVRRPRFTHAFERELDALEQALPPDDAESPETHLSRFFNALESLNETAHGPAPDGPPSSLASRYETAAQAEDAPRKQPEAATEAAAATAADTAPDTTAETVADAAPRPRAEPPSFPLAPGLSAAEINRLRREFARYNHPDRVPVAQREEASRAMAQANAEFDRALKRARER